MTVSAVLPKILLLEDDPHLGLTLAERLEQSGYRTTLCRRLAEAEQLELSGFNLMIVDVNLPDGSGFDFVKRIKERLAVPIIFLTAQNMAEDRLRGYELGADEYIPKPFHFKELLIRVRHVFENHAPPRQVFCRDVKIDLDAQLITRQGEKKEYLASKDFALLELLIISSPQVLSRDQIMDKIWGADKFPSHRTVDNMIVRIRQSIGDEKGYFIRSIRGVGYQWLGAENG